MRRLMYYAKHDQYFEIWGQLTYQSMIDDGWIEVTNDPVHEQLFQLYKAQR